MGIHVAYAHGRLCSEPVLHRQIALLDVWIPENSARRRESIVPGLRRLRGRSRERVWIRDQRALVSKAKSGEKYELPRDSVRDQRGRTRLAGLPEIKNIPNDPRITVLPFASNE